MTVHAYNDHNPTQFEKLLHALTTNVECTIGDIQIHSCEKIAGAAGSKFAVKMTHRKHNHGELIETILRVRLSNDENLLGSHVDAIIQIANMEYIYKDCVYAIETSN